MGFLCAARGKGHICLQADREAERGEETSLSAAFVTQMFVFCIQMCNRKLSSSPL